MFLKKVNLLGISLSVDAKSTILQFIKDYLAKRGVERWLTIFTPNPEQIIFAHEHPEYKEILNSGNINLPDGAGIVWAIKLVHSSQFTVHSNKLLTINCNQKTLMRIPGVEFMEELVNLASCEKYPVAFIGGRNGAAYKALRNLQIKYPGLEGWAEEPLEFEFRIKNYELKIKGTKTMYNHLHDSLFNAHDSTGAKTQEYFKQLAKRIKESGVKLVFVGLGAPKQELFIKKLSSQFTPRPRSGQAVYSSPEKNTDNYELHSSNSLILMSVGGSFDILTRKLTRAPRFLQKLNLEWLWRLILEPWRIYRQIKLIKFVFLVLRDRFMLK